MNSNTTVITEMIIAMLTTTAVTPTPMPTPANCVEPAEAKIKKYAVRI